MRFSWIPSFFREPIKFLWRIYLYPLQGVDALLIFTASRFRPRKIDVLFICGEADLGLFCNGSFVSRYIDPAAVCLSAANFTCERYLWQRSKKPDFLHSGYNKHSLGLIFSNTFVARLFLKYVLTPRLIVAIPVSACLKQSADSLNISTLEPFHGFGIGARDHMWRTDKYVHTGTHFVAYDDQTAHTLVSNQYRYFNVLRCSHPYLSVNQFLQRNLPSPFIRSGKYFSYIPQQLEITNYKSSSSVAGCILITLQHGYDGSHPLFKDILPNGIMHQSLINVIKQRTDLVWMIKPHPAQMSSLQAKQDLFSFLDSTFFECPNVFFQTCHLMDPVDLLRLCSLHITMMSSTVVEAYLLGIHSICLCPTFSAGGVMESAFGDVRQNGFLHHVSLNETSISHAINQILFLRSNEKSAYSQFFDRESLHPSLADVCMALLDAPKPM